MDYVLVPGAWAGAWIWDEVACHLQEREHTTHQLTLSGLHKGEHAASVHLSTHVQDVLEYIESKHLESVILVGHSYSGLVIGQVATKISELVTHTVFIEAFLPVDGKSLLDVSGLDVAHEKGLIQANSGLWPAPTLNELQSQPHLTAGQVKRLVEKQIGHPGFTVLDPAVLSGPLSLLRATFISEEGWLSGSRESELVEALKHEKSWAFRIIPGGHWPMLTVPEQLSAVLHELGA